MSDRHGHASVNADPLLGPLANNGGPTQTLALGAGSPAIGHGEPTTCAAAPPNGAGGKDQRGFIRPSACSIGAYEGQPVIPNPLPVPPRGGPPPQGGPPAAAPPTRPGPPPSGVPPAPAPAPRF